MSELMVLRDMLDVPPGLREGVVMGEPVQVTTCLPVETEIYDAAFEAVRDVEESLSLTLPGSELLRINARDSGRRRFRASDILWDMLTRARAVFERSKGAFDPTAQPLIEAWGFDRVPKVPDKRTLRETMAGVGMGKLDLGRQVLVFEHPGTRLGFGEAGVACAADAAVETLRAHGVSCGTVIAGGAIRVFGGDTWKLDVPNPLEEGKALATVSVREGALATAGHFEKSFEHEGKRFGHLSPREGAKYARLEQTDPQPPIPESIDHRLDRPGRRVGSDYSYHGIVQPVGLVQGVVAAESIVELLGHVQNHPRGLWHGFDLRPLVLVVVVVEIQWAVGLGVVEVQQRPLRRIRTHKVGDRSIPKDLYALNSMAGDEAILADSHRQQHIRMLADAHRLNQIVVGLLAVLREEDAPAAVAHAHHVRVIAVDVDGGGQRPVDQAHHNGTAGGSGDVENLPH